MLRKHIVSAPPQPSGPRPGAGEIDIAATATVYITSEDSAHPIDHAFDTQRGPGGSRWVAAEPGEQTLLLAFDTPQTIRRITLGVEEPGVSRTQELQLAVSRDGGQTYQEVVRQERDVVGPQRADRPGRGHYNRAPPSSRPSIIRRTSGTGGAP